MSEPKCSKCDKDATYDIPEPLCDFHWGDWFNIYVAMYRLDPNRTCHTALLHEFGHCLLGEAVMDRDIDHTNTELWDLVAEVRAETYSRDW